MVYTTEAEARDEAQFRANTKRCTHTVVQRRIVDGEDSGEVFDVVPVVAACEPSGRSER
jgi:hypothetical protein